MISKFSKSNQLILSSLLVSVPYLPLSFALSPDGKCRIIAFKGGGIHGSYEAGALKAITEMSDPADVHWDIVTGVSIGGFVGSVLASHDFGDEEKAADLLVEIFSQTTPDMLFDFWPTIILETWAKSSFTDSTKMTNFLKERP